MKSEVTTKWTIDEEAFRRWLGDNQKEFEPALDPVPTLKALVFLALLNQNSPISYEEIGKIFEEQGVVRGIIPVASLRVAMSELGNVLNRGAHRLQVQSFKVGQRESRFQLLSRVQKSEISSSNVVLINEPKSEKSGEIADSIFEHQRMPFHALYYLPRSACWWVTFSSEEAEERKNYEADSWDTLQLAELIAASSSPVVGVVGLAIGEGLGEIELLRRILTDGYTVHYLAVDLSPVLLVAHIETVREAFRQELRDGRLVCAGILVDVFLELEVALGQARTEFKNRGVFMRDDEFIPSDCPVIATFLGNCLGNDESIREDSILKSISKVFPDNRPLALLCGVSVMQAEPDEYSRTWDEFLLQTPHHLLQNLGILRSRRPSGDQSENGFQAPREFILPSEVLKDELSGARNECRLRRCPRVEVEEYNAPHGIKGQVYRFNYYLDYDLEMVRHKKRLPAHSEIVLYSIIKYKMDTLVEGIRKRQFKVNYEGAKEIKTDNGVRQYAVFLAYLDKKDTL
jgi:hypothetical protein